MNGIPASLRAFLSGFAYAAAGIAHTVRFQRNMRVHILIAAAVTVAGLVLGIGASDWAVVALAMGVVFTAEAMNTAVEHLVNLVSPDQHPHAKLAKDAAAGAVLLAALAAVGVGLAIFLPRLAPLFGMAR